MAILEEETFKEFGYYPKDLSRGSGKKILATCDGCEKLRVTTKSDYCPLCRSCAISRTQKGKPKSEEHKRKIGEGNKPLLGTRRI